MRVPPPGLLKLDQNELLRDVKDRLAERMPSYKNADDPTDPAWLLLEQAAWMVQMLTEQMDRYPFHVVQHFIHMMGGHLLPAQPAVGPLLLEPSIEGVLNVTRKSPRRWRFFTQQTEETDIVEFVPAESGAAIRKLRFRSQAQLEHGVLYTVGKPSGDEGLEAQMSWVGERVPSRVFAWESVRYILVTNNTEKLREVLDKAIERFDERKIGWLKLKVEETGADRLTLIATPDVTLAFAESAPAGLTPPGDLLGTWGTLHGSTWTPPITVSNHPLLPRATRGRRPLPGPEEGTFLIPDVPENMNTADLLDRQASPLPATVVEAIWTTLANLDTRLAPMKPAIKRSFGTDQDTGIPEPDWVATALETGVWPQLRRAKVATLVDVDLTASNRQLDSMRLSFLLDQRDPDNLPVIRAFGRLADGSLVRTPLKTRIAWRLLTPPRSPRGRMELLAAVDVTTSPDLDSVLMCVDGAPLAVFANAIMVINAPTVGDGRSVYVERNVPEGVSLLAEDLVTKEVMDRLLAGPLPRDAARILRRFPLASFGVDGREPVEDYEGIGVDPSAGLLTLNAPDGQGYRRQLRPGTELRLDWYRKTDGLGGEVGPWTISLVEQELSANPRIFACANPVGTSMGMNRETEESATQRLFAPGAGLAVLPADFERLVRQALGRLGQGWVVRCWTYAERALATTALWPVLEPSDDADAETQRLERRLANAGPEQLLVVLGPPDRLLTDDELDRARRVIRQEIRRQHARLPTVSEAIVTRFWPLALECKDDVEIEPPRFDLTGLNGTLRDDKGHTAAPPNALLLLNAGVVRVAGSRTR